MNVRVGGGGGGGGALLFPPPPPPPPPPLPRGRARPGQDGRCRRQARHPARGDCPRFDLDVARGTSPGAERGREEGRSASGRTSGRHHGCQADRGAHSALPLAPVVQRRPRPDGRPREATTSKPASARPLRTGVEMEALTADRGGRPLTVYDMVKAVDKAMVIGDIRLTFKQRWDDRGSYRRQITGIRTLAC